MGRKPIVGIFSVGVEEPYRWKDSVQSAAEIRLWVADGVANGMRPWFTKFSGVLHDQRWLKPVEDIYHLVPRWERYLRNERPLARVGLVYSQQTAWFYGGDRVRERVEDPALGWYQALIEARIPFEMVHDRLLDAAHLAPFKTLILPNIAALSDAQCAPAPRLRRRRRQPRRHHPRPASRRVGRGAQGLRPGRPLRRRLQRAASKARCRTPTCASSTRRRAAPSAPARARRRPAHHQRRVPRRGEADPAVPEPAAHADPVLSRPADGEGLSARAEDRHPAGLPAREPAAGRVSTSPGTSTARSGKCSSVDHFKLLRNAVAWATNEDPPVDRHRTRACST